MCMKVHFKASEYERRNNAAGKETEDKYCERDERLAQMRLALRFNVDKQRSTLKWRPYVE